jgi:hypothetical protein
MTGIHLILVAYIVLSAYLVFGAWKLDFALKAYEQRNRKFAHLMWPKDIKTYILVYRLVATISLAASAALYIYFLLRYQI